MANIKLRNLTKYFDDVKAIEGIDLDIPDRKVTVLLGPSGCGKSTTLRIIAGLTKQTDGKVYLDDQEISDLTPEKRGVAMCFQDLALYPHVTVRENMSLCLEAKDWSDEEIEKKVQEIAEVLGIEALLDRNPGELSGGQAQRVALGRALVRDPEVLLLDEPLSSLDAKLRLEMREEILRIVSELETTTVYVTHNQEEAMELADKIAIYNTNKKISQTGKPIEFYQQPENIYVANFFGSPSMNILDGRLKKSDGVYYFNKNNFELDVTNRIENKKIGTIKIGARPRNIPIHKKGRSIDGLTAEIALIRDRGDEKILTLESEGEKIVGVVKSTEFFERGEKVILDLNKDNTYLFDGDTGETIGFPENLEVENEG